MTAKYSITIDNEDGFNGAPEKPWTATLFNVKAEDRHGMDTGDQLAVGVGVTLSDALRDLVDNAGTIPGDMADPCPEAEDGVAHQVSDGSCDLCGAKNFD